MGYEQRRQPGSKWSPYRFFRRIRTTQERRFWDDAYGRAARSPSRLPNAWDDLSRHIERNWKRQRKTQYREVAMSDDRYTEAELAELTRLSLSLSREDCLDLARRFPPPQEWFDEDMRGFLGMTDEEMAEVERRTSLIREFLNSGVSREAPDAFDWSRLHLFHRGFRGRVNKPEGGVVHGRVDLAADVVTFEAEIGETPAETLEAIQREFAASVDDYLDWMMSEGITPDSPR